MQPTLCSRCKKNVAVIFITRMDPSGQQKNEGLCLKCARELHIKPVDDIINKMGISDEDLDNLTNEMMDALGSAEGLMDIENSDSDSDDDGKTATFPFLNRLMGGQNAARDDSNLPAQTGGGASQGGPAPQSAPPQRPKRILPVRDVRLFLNTVKHSLEVIQSAGIKAACGREDTEDEIVLTIRLPKKAG